MRKIQKILCAFCLTSFFGFSWFGRIHPVSLERAAPLSLEAEIKGEVQNPGVYELKTGAKIKDLISAAGGTSEQADLSAISEMQEVAEGEVLVIPAAREARDKNLISINTATEEELQQLSGIGPALSARIIEYRNTSSFSCLEDLMNVKGIGEKMFEKIRDEICL